MKRAFASFLLVLILLNTAGYYLVFQGWQWHSNLSWIDAHESLGAGNELIVRVPFAVPYASESDEWIPAQGRYEHEGKMYRIVRQRLALDAVYIALVNDAEGTLINHHMAEFAKSFSDKPENAKQPVKIFTGLIKEYMTQRVVIASVDAGWNKTCTYSEYLDTLIPSYVSSIVHPPERG